MWASRPLRSSCNGYLKSLVPVMGQTDMVRAFLLTTAFAASLFSEDQSTKFTGVLLDAQCAASIGVKTANTPAAAELRASGDVRENPNYTRGDLVPCQATITSTAFSLLTPEGKILRFDSQANGKLLTQIETSQEWKDALNSVTGTPNDSLSQAQSQIKAPNENDADRRRTAGKDVTGSGATTTRGTSRQVEVQGRMTNELLRAESVRLAPNVKAN